MLNSLPMKDPLRQSRFLLAETEFSRLPPSQGEVAFIGRSNVGKSSLISAICDNKKLARVSKTVQLNLETDGFVYQKWGAEQRCQRGDWLVDNNGDIYTVDGEVFSRTNRQLNPGVYVKATAIWAEVADQPGAVDTKEGRSHYQAGDYLVSNNEEGTDAYCISAEKFEAMYEADD